MIKLDKAFNNVFFEEILTYMYEIGPVLEIDIKNFVRNDFFRGMSLDINVVDKICKYVDRYYSDKSSDTFSFQISINNYTDFISKIVFRWNRNKYREFEVAVALKATGTRGPFRLSDLR